MKTKAFIFTWILTFIVVFGLNGLFHSVLAASFFDNHLSMIGGVKKMSASDPAPVALLDFILVFGMTFLIARTKDGRISLREGAWIGGLINLISSGAWNLANSSMFNWPVIVTIGDIMWHVFLGSMGGTLVAALLNYFQRNRVPAES
jgi:uncharacterized membrane protein